MRKPLLEKLIQEIAMFDMDAAYKLHQRKDNQDYEDKDSLDTVMSWHETKEGIDYWNDISDRLEERRKNYHPHRDLMIEYANDKTIEIQVLIDDKWEDVKEPLFSYSFSYRKKPKVTKKVIEYRIYLDQENEIHMIDASYPIPSNFKEWIEEWKKIEIEVEEND